MDTDPLFPAIGQINLKLNNLASGDESRSYYTSTPIAAVRIFVVSPARLYTVQVLSSPTGKPNQNVVLQTLTEATPSVVIPGPVGQTIQVKCVTTTDPLDVYVCLMENK